MAGDYDFFTPPAVGSAPNDPAPAPEPVVAPGPARGLSVRAVLAAVLVLALLGGSYVARRVAFPPQYDNLVAHAEVSAAAAGWAPLYTSGGVPSRWDACQPIHYIVNAQGSPPSGVKDLAGALARISKASGLQFVYDGPSTELPQEDRPATVRGNDGKPAWAPMLVAWTPMGREGGVEGLTVPVAVSGPDGGSIVTATVSINSDLLLPPGFGPGVSEGLVVLHELGHAVGLGHVSDPAQVMYPQVKGGYADLGVGDRAGLRALGAAAGCHPAPAPRPLRLRQSGTG